MKNNNKKSGWIGVDLDGTLAYDEPGAEFHPTKIGEPIQLMLARVKEWLADGIEVRVFTARASELGRGGAEKEQVVAAIEEWCELHVGKKLVVTNIKDYNMIELWDDRARQVERNTGELSTDVAYDRGYQESYGINS